MWARLLTCAAVANLSFAASLVDDFKSSTVFWQQLEIAKKIVEAHDPGVLPQLTPYLTHDDRHIRANTAFIFAALGDPRGLETIAAIFNDRSERGEGQGIPSACSTGRCPLEAQISADRYYAVHILGQLKDPKTVPILLPLLKDPDVDYNVAWALGEIGGHEAIEALIEALHNPSADVRVIAIHSLQKLKAREALPALRPLLNDHAQTHFGQLISVSEAAQTAISTLEAAH